MSKGVDFAFRSNILLPNVTSLKGQGVAFVGRYVSTAAINDSNGKNLLLAERNRYIGAGLSIILYAEEGAPGFMLGGYQRGVAIAQHALLVSHALQLLDIPVYYAADWDATESEQAAINGFLDGAASVHGYERCGIYGGYHVVKRTLDAKKANYSVQTMAWSGTAKDAPVPPGADKVLVGGSWRLFDQRANVRQTTIIKIDGVECDLLESRTADYGQWPRPAPIAMEDQMGQLTTTAFETFPAGKFHRLHLYRDFVTATSPVVLRVALHSQASGYQVIDNYKIAGSEPQTISFAKSDVTAVSIVLKSGPAPVGYSLS